ncbi:MAG: TOBE domain-containing protein [Terracoccus sp.]
MRLSTRNQLPGTVVSVVLGEAMAVVKIKLDGSEQVITSSITRDAAVDLGLKAGAAVVALVKSTEVAIGVE